MFKKTSLKINKFKKIYLIISLCLFVWMFFSISIETGETTFLNKLMYRLSGTVFSFILLWGWSIPTYFIVKYIIKKNDANNFNHEIENKNYFRENLDDTPIFIISYLYNKNIDRKRDVPAHIMKLMVDGYIKEENGKYVVTNKDTSNLLYTDKTIINFIKNNYNKYMLDNYEDDVYMDVLEQGYVTEKILLRV